MAGLPTIAPAADLARLLLDRRDRHSQPGRRSDGRRVALVIEGGGMRGVIAGGMVSALEELSLLEAFDVVYGASAGAIVGAYFIAAQARYGTRIFSEDINNRRFIDRCRLWRGSPVVSVDFLIDEVCASIKPLHAARVLDNPVPLRVIASDVRGRQRVVLGGFPDRTALMQALRGSSRIPYFAGPPVPYADHHLLDALLFEPVPFPTALAEGASDVVVLLTRPGTVPAVPRSPVERMLMSRYLNRLHPSLSTALDGAPGRYAELLDAIGTAAATGDPVRCLPVQVRPGQEVASTETNRGRLLDAAEAGRTAAHAAFAAAELSRA